MKSEFGKGLTYNLGLFLAHQDRFYDKRNKEDSSYDKLYPSLWFSGACDHLYELIIPKTFPKKLQKKIKDFESKVFKFRSFDYDATEKDIEWSLNEAKDILLDIDKQLGIKAIKGDYE